jgi:hypothetical protein
MAGEIAGRQIAIELQVEPRRLGRPRQIPDLKRSAQKDLKEAQTQIPLSSFSSLPFVGRTAGNEENEQRRRGISIPQLF